MAQKPWTVADDANAQSMIDAGETDAYIAESLGRSKDSVQARRRRLGKTNSERTKEMRKKISTPESESLHVDESGDTAVITSKSSTVRTLAQAISAAEIDTDIWEVERFVANKWDNASKMADRNKVQVVELWQIKVWLKRRVPKAVSSAADVVISRMNAHAPKYPKFLKPKKLTDPHLFYIGLHDHHFGKLCWAAETNENYDLKIAEALYERAGEELVRKAAGFPIERFVLPLGHDFLHVDGYDNMTTGGTPQDVDGRFAKIFDCGQMAVVRLVDYLLAIAPVDVLWIPGNHDYQASRMLAKTIEAWYRNCDRVTVDCAPAPRKHVHYGVNLIGCTHGCDEKISSLPGIMAMEWPQEWAQSKCREWLIGDKHKAKETHYDLADTHDGVMVRILPSLAGTDLWHFKKGYVGGTGKAAQGLLYSRTDGFSGQFNANVWRQP